MDNQMNGEGATARSEVTTLDSNTFKKVILQGRGRLTVEFMSYGCGYCRAIEPLLQKVANEAEDFESVFRVDVTASPDLAQEFQIVGTPTFVIFDNGQELRRTEGPDPNLSSVRDAVTGQGVS